MNYYNKKEVTQSELIKWKSNPELNPRTNRKITEKGEVYKYLKNCYDKQFSNKLYETIDDKDPISLAVFWIEENGNRRIIYNDISSLIFYKDSYNLVRCFERETLEYLKAHNITKHPTTMEEIPNDVFKNICAKDLQKEKKRKTNNEIAFEIFQKLSSLSIFIDSELFMNLDKKKLIKFNYEISDMYKKNFSSYQLKEISNRLLFSKYHNEIESMTLDSIQKYLLQDIDELLSVKKNQLKYMCNYLLVGSLSIVIPKIRTLYPDICFNFII